ncbi:hypothetical protein SUGI_0026860 [Cryptomeria japonica]|nr:hypothetical protein SUGI_0026860 [Cryptomeria japonica]
MLTTSLTCHKGNGKKAEGKYRTSLGVETFPESPSSSKNALHSTAASLTNGKSLKDKGVIIFPENKIRFRIVTHHQISEDDVRYVISCFQEILLCSEASSNIA